MIVCESTYVCGTLQRNFLVDLLCDLAHDYRILICWFPSRQAIRCDAVGKMHAASAHAAIVQRPIAAQRTRWNGIRAAYIQRCVGPAYNLPCSGNVKELVWRLALGPGQNTACVRYVKPYQRPPQGRAQTVVDHSIAKH